MIARSLLLSAIVLLGAISTAPAFALHRIPVKPLAGYKCMAIDAPDSVAMDFQHPIPLQTEPRANAPVISPALGVLPVATDVDPTNGYVRSMNMMLKPGWVPAKYVRPYSDVHPGASCVPYVMNDGKLGFVFGH
ncbi:hypothetical protein A0U90_14240 (plasmid) [Kozakia baliensis]|nr:hypothetical protein A0U90_14240 [Kozakia baliensis]